MNVDATGAPVRTSDLKGLGLPTELFASEFMSRLLAEQRDIEAAQVKVAPAHEPPESLP
jgi:hypothetical protein